jgi:acyl carrier protein
MNTFVQPERDPEGLLHRLVDEVRHLVFSADVLPESTLAELGIDSVTVVDLLITCEDIYNIMIQPEHLQIDEFTTLRSLHSQVLSSGYSAPSQPPIR